MTGTALKLIAVFTMLIDHAGDVLFPDLMWMRYIGRLAFPIYCFLIVEGFIHTRSVIRYMARLLLFGIISEVPFDLAFFGTLFDPDYQNVFWTLLLGLMSIYLMSLVQIEDIRLRLPLQMLICVPFAVIGQLAHTDYRWIGVVMISGMYLFRNMEILRIATAGIVFLPVFINSIEYFGMLSFIPMHFYNGRRGKTGTVLKWAFYMFYPMHLIALAYIRDRITGW
jgi:hypothetical protein